MEFKFMCTIWNENIGMCDAEDMHFFYHVCDMWVFIVVLLAVYHKCGFSRVKDYI